MVYLPLYLSLYVYHLAAANCEGRARLFYLSDTQFSFIVTQNSAQVPPDFYLQGNATCRSFQD